MDPKQPGLLELALRDAAVAAKVDLSIERKPPVRCRKAIEEGAADLALLTPVPASLLIAELPMRGSQVDTEQRVLQVSVVVVRRRGETAWQWDGERFLRHQPRVGVKRGIQAYTERLGRMGLDVDDAAFNSDQLLRKLLAGRVDVALLSGNEFEQLQAQDLRELEALPQPFMQLDVYLGISRKIDAAQRPQALRLWQELARRRPVRPR